MEKRAEISRMCEERPQELAKLIDFAEGAIVSKTILDEANGGVTLFAFDEGQKLSEHTAPFDALVQIVEGRARVVIGDRQMELEEGQVVVMRANVPHSVEAVGRLKMSLTLIRR